MGPGPRAEAGTGCQGNVGGGRDERHPGSLGSLRGGGGSLAGFGRGCVLTQEKCPLQGLSLNSGAHTSIQYDLRSIPTLMTSSKSLIPFGVSRWTWIFGGHYSTPHSYERPNLLGFTKYRDFCLLSSNRWPSAAATGLVLSPRRDLSRPVGSLLSVPPAQALP